MRFVCKHLHVLIASLLLIGFSVTIIPKEGINPAKPIGQGYFNKWTDGVVRWTKKDENGVGVCGDYNVSALWFWLFAGVGTGMLGDYYQRKRYEYLDIPLSGKEGDFIPFFLPPVFAFMLVYDALSLIRYGMSRVDLKEYDW
jgi:hypothetical protein